MAKRSHHDIRRSLRDLRWPLRLTRLGLIAENGWRAFWPFLSLVMAVLAALMLGLQDSVLVEVVWAAAVVVAVGLLASLYYAARVFRWPSSGEALDRLDATLPGRPIQAMLDDQTIGASDPASAAVWRAHQSRMADRASAAKPVPADLRIARYDPYALRYGAAIFLVCALVFGSLGRVASVSELAPGDADALATGPVWEGWAESPRYTGRPTIYLNDIAEGPLALPVGTLITVRFYGEVGALTLAETVSGRVTDVGSAADPQQDFTIASEGQITISGPGGRVWDIAVLPDQAPNVAALRDPDVGPLGEMTLPFRAADDYGVEAGEARISLDLASVDRRHGLSLDPEARPEIVVPLPMPFAGSRASFEENLIEDFSEHPWANLPVSITLSVLDAAEQQGISEPRMISLPGRRFFDPLAAAIVEQRRDLLWNRGNADRIALILRAVAHLPDDVFRKETDQLRMRQLIRKLEMQASYGLSDEQQDQLAKDMWDFALKLEEGDLASALERLRQAQERLEQAMRDGASQDEIDRLMDEMRRATQDYLDQLSRQAQQEGQQNQQPGEQGDPQNQMQITQDDLQQMMDRIQELMEQGRMAEAEQALQELQELLENLRMSQNQGQQGGQSPGEQAMEGLAETLRNQQGLSDEAFRDLQEQFNPDAQAGESQQNQGRDGGQGEGQQHSQGGSGEQSRNPSQGGQGGNQSQNSEGGDGGLEGSLADRQRALRDELGRQHLTLPFPGTPEGDAARDALDRAGRAMDNAEDSLRQRDFSDAIDNQSQAMEALREGMRALGEQMAQQQQQQQGQGQGMSEADRMAENRDPLGRMPGANGDIGTDESLLQGDDVYRRARELLDEIRRRSGEGERPDVELDYLKRLLDRF